MFATHVLKARLETAAILDGALQRDLVDLILPSATAALGDKADAACFDSVFTWADGLYPGFLYLAWRTTDGRHHCSIALEKDDLDRHGWMGVGASPALALASALVASIESDR